MNMRPVRSVLHLPFQRLATYLASSHRRVSAISVRPARMGPPSVWLRFSPMKGVSGLLCSFSFPDPIRESLRRYVAPALGPQLLCDDGQAEDDQERGARSWPNREDIFRLRSFVSTPSFGELHFRCSQPESIRTLPDETRFEKVVGRKSLLTPGRGIRVCRYQAPAVLPELQSRPVRSADLNSVGASNHHFEQPGFCTGHTNTCRAPPEV
jgi:hypothetical protein